MIIRVAKRQQWTVVNNATIDDDRLSWRALGVLTFLLRQPDNWEANYRHLATLRSDGQHAVRMVLKELEDNGYIERHRERQENGQFEWVQVIYETAPCLDNRGVDDPGLADRGAVSGSITSTRGATTEEEEKSAAGAAASRLPIVINIGGLSEETVELPWSIPSSVPNESLVPAIELCDLLGAQLRERGETVQNARSKRWVLDMEALLRLDERDPAHVARVLNWLHGGKDEVSSFWRINVRSPAKLRSKWIRMGEQYERAVKKPVQQKMPITDDARDVVAQHYREHGAAGGSALTSQPALNRGA